MLARERRCRQVLCGRARPHRIGGPIAQANQRAGDLGCHVFWDGDRSMIRRISALIVWIASRSPGVERDSRSSRSMIEGAPVMI